MFGNKYSVKIAWDRLKTDLWNCKIALVILLMYVLFTQVRYHTVCPFAIVFHFSCPACGLTRAGLSVLSGRFERAWQWNPTIYLWMPLILWWGMERYLVRKHRRALLAFAILVGIMTFVVYGYRMVCGNLLGG